MAALILVQQVIPNCTNRCHTRNAGIDFSQSVPVDRPTSAALPLVDDPTFKRLATLVIELKERVVAVENQVAAIAKERSPGR